VGGTQKWFLHRLLPTSSGDSYSGSHKFKAPHGLIGCMFWQKDGELQWSTEIYRGPKVGDEWWAGCQHQMFTQQIPQCTTQGSFPCNWSVQLHTRVTQIKMCLCLMSGARLQNVSLVDALRQGLSVRVTLSRTQLSNVCKVWGRFWWSRRY
jgi:hypothetical protein